MKVRELMTADPSCAGPETTVEEIATIMRDENIGCVPVVDEDGQVAGVVTDRDIVIRCIAEGKDPAECSADEIISPQSITISPDADAKEAAQLMAEHQIRRLPVVEKDSIVGMLSLGDVAVKQDDDRMSGDVLQEVSEGVKSADDASNLPPHGGGSRSGVKTSTANRTEAGRSSSGKTTGSQQNFSRQKKSSGITPEESLSEDARLSSRYEAQGISNHDVGEEMRRQEKVLPFRERTDNRVRSEANRVREEAGKREGASGRGRKKAG